jgi:hypothetical protein
VEGHPQIANRRKKAMCILGDPGPIQSGCMGNELWHDAEAPPEKPTEGGGWVIEMHTMAMAHGPCCGFLERPIIANTQSHHAVARTKHIKRNGVPTIAGATKSHETMGSYSHGQ